MFPKTFFSVPIFAIGMKELFYKYKLELSGSLIGAAGGWCYWYFVGCSNGTCSITSSPVASSFYGMFMGILLFGIFKK